MWYNFGFRKKWIFYTLYINQDSLGYAWGTTKLKISVANITKVYISLMQICCRSKWCSRSPILHAALHQSRLMEYTTSWVVIVQKEITIESRSLALTITSLGPKVTQITSVYNPMVRTIVTWPWLIAKDHRNCDPSIVLEWEEYQIEENWKSLLCP